MLVKSVVRKIELKSDPGQVICLKSHTSASFICHVLCWCDSPIKWASFQKKLNSLWKCLDHPLTPCQMDVLLPRKHLTLLLWRAGGASFEATSHITRGWSLGDVYPVESWLEVLQFLLMQFEVVGFSGRGREMRCTLCMFKSQASSTAALSTLNVTVKFWTSVS